MTDQRIAAILRDLLALAERHGWQPDGEAQEPERRA